MGSCDQEDEDDEDCREDEQGFFADEVANVRRAVGAGEDHYFVAALEGAGVEDHAFIVVNCENAAGLIFDTDFLDGGGGGFGAEDFGLKSFLFGFNWARGDLPR